MVPLLDPVKNVTLSREKLPQGRLPVWIERPPGTSDATLLEYIKHYHVMDNETVTVLHERLQKDGEEFCKNNGWEHITIENMQKDVKISAPFC